MIVLILVDSFLLILLFWLKKNLRRTNVSLPVGMSSKNSLEHSIWEPKMLSCWYFVGTGNLNKNDPKSKILRNGLKAKIHAFYFNSQNPLRFRFSNFQKLLGSFSKLKSCQTILWWWGFYLRQKKWNLWVNLWLGSKVRISWTPALSSTLAMRLRFPGHRLQSEFIKNLYILII